MSKALAIRDYFLAELSRRPLSGIEDSHIYLQLNAGLARAQRPAIVLEMGSESIDESQYEECERVLSLIVRVIVDGDDPMAAADPVVMAIDARLAALDPGDLFLSITLSRIERQSSDIASAALVSLAYDVRYATPSKIFE